MTQPDTNIVSVTVIIPTFNRAHIVSRAINSALAQTYQDFEIVVVDDGSTDNTGEIVKSIKDERIKYLRHEINKGPAAARNTGLKAAAGQYIAFLDSDDEWLPEKLARQVDVMQKASPDIGVVYSTAKMVIGNCYQFLPLGGLVDDNVFENILGGNLPVTSTLLVRKDCLLAVGSFDEDFSSGEDWDIMIRLAKRYGFKAVPEALAVYYRMPDSIADRKYVIAGYKDVLQKYSGDLKNHKAVYCRVCTGLGHNLCMDGNAREGRDYFFKAVKMCPLYINALLSFIIALSGPRLYNKFFEIYHNMKAVRI